MQHTTPNDAEGNSSSAGTSTSLGDDGLVPAVRI